MVDSTNKPATMTGFVVTRRKVVVDPTERREREIAHPAVPTVLRLRLEMNAELHVIEFWHRVLIGNGPEGEPVYEERYNNTVLQMSYPNVYDNFFLFHYIVEGSPLDLLLQWIEDEGLGYDEEMELVGEAETHFMWTLVGYAHFLEVVTKDSLLNPGIPVPHIVSRLVPTGTDLGFAKLDCLADVLPSQQPHLREHFDRRLTVKLTAHNDQRQIPNMEELLVNRRRDHRRTAQLYDRSLRTLVDALRDHRPTTPIVHAG